MQLLQVKGRLLALGTKESPIIFTSVRQDGVYKSTPGQWRGLVFDENNEESSLRYVEISNAEIALQLGSPKSSKGVPLRIGHSIVRHMSQGGLLSYGGRTFVHNTLIYNAKSYLVSHKGGGVHRYLHCTLSNYPSSFVERSFSMQITDILPSSPQDVHLLELRIENTILWGSFEEELDLNLEGQPQLYIENSLFLSSSGKYLSTGNNLWENNYNYPGFVNAEAYDYSLEKESPARDAAKLLSDPEQQQDLEGKPRSSQPDIGAYEWAPKVEQVDKRHIRR